MIKNLNIGLLESNISYGDLVIMEYLSTNDTDLLAYLTMLEHREKDYIYDRINYDNVNHLITTGYITGITKDKEKFYVNEYKSRIKDVHSYLQLTEKGKSILNKFKENITTISSVNCIDIYEKFSKYWYDDNNLAYRVAALGSETEFRKALSEFREKHKYSDDIILKAVNLFFKEYKEKNIIKDDNEELYNWIYLTGRTEFIKGTGIKKLNVYCEAAKNAKLLSITNDIIISS